MHDLPFDLRQLCRHPLALRGLSCRARLLFLQLPRACLDALPLDEALPYELLALRLGSRPDVRPHRLDFLFAQPDQLLDLHDSFHRDLHIPLHDTLHLDRTLDHLLHIDHLLDLDNPLHLNLSLYLDQLLHLHQLLLYHVHHLLLGDATRQTTRRPRSSTPVASSLFQLGPQPSDLILELAQHSILRVFIDLRLVLDVLRAVGVAKCGERLVIVPVGRAKVGNHHGLRVPAERVLQQPRQLGVAVRNVRALAVDERGDAIAQRGEAEVDLRRLLEPISRSLRLRLPFRARQVDQVQLPHADGGGAIRARLARLHRDRVDRVRAAGVLVHCGRADVAVLRAEVAQLVALARRLDDVRRQVAHVDARLGGLLQVEFVVWVLGEQVPDLFIVDLEV
mmetsp:Transcript_33957/g.77860  ORF Transcript_33957/g.77860 Transcript_33957/m.77860 type:complete len:393 (+) Transcript_33957:1380-2558(+)